MVGRSLGQMPGPPVGIAVGVGHLGQHRVQCCRLASDADR
jgi:hypothetical protein